MGFSRIVKRNGWRTDGLLPNQNDPIRSRAIYDNSSKTSLNQKVQIHQDGSKEYWRDVPGYQGLYRVSDWGRLKSLGSSFFHRYFKRIYRHKPKFMKLGSSGHLGTVLTNKDGKRKNWPIQQLVLMAFVGPKPISKEKIESRHLDGNPGNNHVSNLAWGTAKQNNQDRYVYGNGQYGEANPIAKLTEEKVLKIRQMRKDGFTWPEIAKAMGISPGGARWAGVLGWKHLK